MAGAEGKITTKKITSIQMKYPQHSIIYKFLTYIVVLVLSILNGCKSDNPNGKITDLAPPPSIIFIDDSIARKDINVFISDSLSKETISTYYIIGKHPDVPFLKTKVYWAATRSLPSVTQAYIYQKGKIVPFYKADFSQILKFDDKASRKNIDSLSRFLLWGFSGGDIPMILNTYMNIPDIGAQADSIIKLVKGLGITPFKVSQSKQKKTISCYTYNEYTGKVYYLLSSHLPVLPFLTKLLPMTGIPKRREKALVSQRFQEIICVICDTVHRNGANG
jgi:hypothetical protein